MPSFPVLSGKDVCRILRSHGFIEVRRKGSHTIMQKRLTDSTITVPVPVPDHKELCTGTLQSIIRQSQIHKTAWRNG